MTAHLRSGLRSRLLPALVSLLLLSGCARTLPAPPTATQPAAQSGAQPATQPGAQPGAQPATQPGAQPATQPGAQPSTGEVVTLPPLEAESIVGAHDGKAIVLRANHTALFAAVAAGWKQAATATVGGGSAPSDFRLSLQTNDGQRITLAVAGTQEVVATVAGKEMRIRSAALAEALTQLHREALALPSDLLADVAPPPGGDWVRAERTWFMTWNNPAEGLSLTAIAWRGEAKVEPDGTWAVTKQNPGIGVKDPTAIQLQGERPYPAVLYRPVEGGTGGGFWGTHPWQADLVAEAGGLSLGCNSTVTSQDARVREAAQAVVNERCPALLAAMRVGNLGAPLTPSFQVVEVPKGQPALLEPAADGYRLIFPPNLMPQWQGRLVPGQYGIEPGWLFNLTRMSVEQAPAAPGPGPGGGIVDVAVVLGYTPQPRPYHGLFTPDRQRLVWFNAQPGAAADYPKVDGVSIWDGASGKIEVRSLPKAGYVDRLLWDRSGALFFNLFWGPDSTVMQLRPADGTLLRLTPDGAGSFVGLDGCALVLLHNEWRRYKPQGCQDPSVPEGLSPLPEAERMIQAGGRLIAFVREDGMVVLDTETGQRYWAAGLLPPYWPLGSTNMGLAPFLPEDGYVGFAMQTYPQVIYHLVPVVRQ